jgi:hypothetical protein
VSSRMSSPSSWAMIRICRSRARMSTLVPDQRWPMPMWWSRLLWRRVSLPSASTRSRRSLTRVSDQLETLVTQKKLDNNAAGRLAGQVHRIDPFHRPPRGWLAGHRAEQLALVAQHRQMRQRVPAISDHHRQVGRHPARQVPHRISLIGVQQRLRPPGRQPGIDRQLPQQQRPRTRHQPGPVRTEVISAK